MTIETKCPECGKACRLADDRAGESLECKGCGGDVPVPRRKRGGQSAAKPAAAPLWPWLAVGGGVFFLLLAGLVVVIVVLVLNRPTSKPQQAEDPAPQAKKSKATLENFL